MVHRAPDSRLLTNLITNEKEYAKHYAALFPLSHAALASLSAYAAASPASPAHTIAAIVDLFASADDALQRYTNALDNWREQLVALKALEDDLSTVLRDRDILVTRLIKASKATRDAHRSSLRLAPLSGIGSASLSSLPSSNSSAGHATPSGTSPANTNAKLAQAQAELQACEAHLVNKERELDARRISIVRDGLGARCRALIDCGWVWGEMGKQGLRALQALGANGSALTGASVSSRTRPLKEKEERDQSAGTRIGSLPTHPTYGSDNSSLTPSQSASQMATLSVEASQEGRASKEHEPAPEARTDVTIAVPPAHAIPELTLPTAVRSPVPQGSSDSAAQTHDAVQTKPAPIPTPASAPKRRGTKRGRRPPSQHIVEVPDEDSDPLPLPAPNASTNVTVNANTSTHAGSSASARTVFPISTTTTTTTTITPARTTTANTAHDDSSDDDDPVGPLQVVENDPFEVIRRRSALGAPPSASAPPLPTAPSGKANIETRPSPSKPALASTGLGRGVGVPTQAPAGAVAAAKRERRTSISLFGSLRGLFRKPKEREQRAASGMEPDAGGSSPKKQNGHAHANRNGGWVTRTDARINGGQRRRGTGIDSDSDLDVSLDAGATGTTVVSVVRGPSGRLRKGRPRGAHAEDNVPTGGTMDGWATDSAAPTIDLGTRTRKGTTKRQKTSVADLRGTEQGHTDGEADERTGRGRSKVEEAAHGRVLARRTSGSVSKGDTKPSGDLDVQHRRTATTTATVVAPTSSRQSTVTHRRSASLSVVDTPMALVSTSTQPLQKLSPPLPPPAPPARASTELTQKHTNGRRATVGHGNGKGRHEQSQSLMSIVAGWDGGDERDKARSLDLPRAPGSVLPHDSATAGVSLARPGQAQEVRRHGPVGQEQVKMPLRSALRNPSRTPSPSPPLQTPPPARNGNGTEGEKRQNRKEDARANDATMRRASWRDSLSVSSYATGRESLDGDLDSDTELGPSTSVSPRSSAPVLTIPPPPVEPPPARPRGATMSEQPSVRRKSVRVSLQPTFSPTPPALRDDDRDEYGLGGNAVATRKHTWDGDSTSEDESEAAREYSRAKALLSLAGGEQDKGKARAR